jgi:type I restriction enzyme S subunit
MPILRMGNIQRGEIVLEDLKYVSLPQDILAPYMVHKGDVLFNRTNSQEHVGKVGIYRSGEHAVFASYLIRLIPDTSQIDSFFLGQLLNSYSAQCRIKRYATPGVEQVNINATNLGKVLIPVPTGEDGLKEQSKIADILETADDLIRGYHNPGPIFYYCSKQLRPPLAAGRLHLSRTTLEV